MSQFYSRLSDKIDQDASTLATHLCIIIFLLISKGFIASFLASMWYYTESGTKHYRFVTSVYLHSCIFIFLALLAEQLVHLDIEKMLLVV